MGTQDYLHVGGSSNNDSSHIAGKLVYSSSQRYKDHMGAKNGPGDSKSPNVAEDRGEGTAAFKKR